MLKQVLKIVKNAGELVVNCDFKVASKGKKENLVTSSDLKIQKYLHKELKKLLPDSCFLAEENNQNDKVKGYQWIIDPIDGTNNYVKGMNLLYTISVALRKNNKTILGVVYCPGNHEIFYAYKGKSYHNDQLIHVSNRKFKDAIYCTGLALYKKHKAKVCSDILYDVYSKCCDFRRLGSAALEICYLAAGYAELYFEISIFAWDFAAGVYILECAGGVSSIVNNTHDYSNHPIMMVAANNKENFKLLNNIVKKHL